MKFRVVLPEFPFSRCLTDLADCVVDGLRRAGHQTDAARTFNTQLTQPETTIVLGAHHPQVTLPDYPVVIYQTEVPGTSWFTPQYKTRLKTALAVWEAAPGFVTQEPARTSVVPPGLMTLSLEQTPAKDIDFLFYGSLSERRIAILTMLQSAGLAPSVHFNVFGAERDALIDRSKVVLDIKQREGDPDDDTRLFVPASRVACVLSENDRDKSRALVPWDIVRQCKALLGEGPRAQHITTMRADLVPMNVSAAVTQLEGILRERARPRAIPAE